MNTILSTRPDKSAWRTASRIAARLVMGMALVNWRATADVTIHTSGPATTLQPGEKVLVRWSNDLGSETVDIDLWDGVRGTAYPIVSGVDAIEREIAWIIPPGTQDGTRYRVRVRDSRNPSRVMSTVGFHTIANARPLFTSTEETATGDVALALSPTPASERVRLTWSAPVSRVDVFDTRGRLAKSFVPDETSRTCNLDVGDLAIGAYSVQTHGVSGNIHRRALLISR